jgi:peroxiredoxin
VNVGDQVPDLELATTDGRRVHLAEYRGEAMVLVFMRHLG